MERRMPYQPPYAPEQGVVFDIAKEPQRLIPGRPLLIFFQGRVLDRETRRIPEGSATSDLETDVNMWSHDLARAGATLVRLGVNDSVVVMGGRTAQGQYGSGSEILAQNLIGEFPPDGQRDLTVGTEQDSYDTITNITNFLAVHDAQLENQADREFDILCAPYHIDRTEIILNMYGVKVGNRFDACEVVRYVARTTEEDQVAVASNPAAWDHATLGDIQARTSPNPNNIRFSGQAALSPDLPSVAPEVGVDAQDYASRLISDYVFLRELVEHPLKWVPYVGDLANDVRLERSINIVETLYPGYLASEFGVGSGDEYDTIRGKLTSKKGEYSGMSTMEIEQWGREGVQGSWPAGYFDQLSKIKQAAKSWE
jgi:hypothetical protein